jgi:hypothetical protein
MTSNLEKLEETRMTSNMGWREYIIFTIAIPDIYSMSFTPISSLESL